MRKTNEKRRILLNSIIVSVSSLFEKIIFAAISIVVAHYLTKEDYGKYTTAFEFATFFAVLTDIGITQALIRGLKLESHLEAERFGNTILIKTMQAFMTYIILSVSLVFFYLSGSYDATTVYLILLFALVRFGSHYLLTFYAFYEAKERFLVPTVMNGIFSFTFLVATVVVVVFNGTFFDLAYARLAVVVVALLAVGRYTFQGITVSINKKTIRQHIREAIPFGLHHIYYNVIQRINIIMLSSMMGTVYSGVFNNGYIFFITLSILPSNFNKILVPYLYSIVMKKETVRFQFAFDIFGKFFGILSFYLFLVFFLYSRNFVPLIFGAKYSDSVPVVQLLAFGIPFLFHVATVLLISLDRQQFNSRIYGVATLFNIVGNVVLIKYFQMEGAAVATVLTYAIIFFGSNWYLYRVSTLSYLIMVRNYALLALVASACIGMERFLLGGIHWMVSSILLTAAYLLLVACCMIRKNDLRIFIETIGMQEKFPLIYRRVRN